MSIRILSIGAAVGATAALFVALTSTVSAASQKPKEIVVVGSKTKQGTPFKSVGGLKTEQVAREKNTKGLRATGSRKRDGAYNRINTYTLQNAWPK